MLHTGGVYKNSKTQKGSFLVGYNDSMRQPDGKFYYVFSAVNLINNKIYVGKRTSRYNKESYLGSGKNIVNAVNKYGSKNFSKTILEYCVNPEELLEREIFWIKLLGTHKIDSGYNLVLDSSKGMEGLKHSKETKENYSKNRSKEKHWAWGRFGKDNPNYNKEVSEDWKKMISKINKGRKMTPEHRERLIKINTNKPQSESSKRKKRKISKKNWSSKKYREKVAKNLAESRRKSGNHKVYQYSLKGELVKEWLVIGDATNYYKKTSINNAVKNMCKSAAGYLWLREKVDNFHDNFVWNKSKKKYDKI